jgi:beta-lactamase regulating signal transducer with metallopeptidase domain
MAAQRRNMPEQEHSIKVRSHELFVEETPVGPAKSTKPFAVFLKETPAQPLSASVLALLWAVGVIVGVLFLLAVWRVVHRQSGKAPPRRAAAKAAILQDARRTPLAGVPRA